MVDRYGYDGGYFVSPKGTSYTESALSVGTDKKTYMVFEVVKPVKVQSGKIAPCFGEKVVEFNMNSVTKYLNC